VPVAVGEHAVHGLFRLLGREPQSHQRFHDLAAQRAGCRHGRGLPAGRAERGDLVAQFERQPLGALAADPRNLGEHGDVAFHQRGAELFGFEHGQRRERQPRADARHGLQQAEQLARLFVGEAEQRQRVLAHDQRGVQPHLFAAAQRRECRRGGLHGVTDAADLDHRVVKADGQHFAAN
jgi:hypothetical protein